LSEEKGIKELLQAFRYVIAKQKNIKLLIVGNGSLANLVERYKGWYPEKL
jgi:glycosyltransferase involved in cell wall biosynthesis